MICQIIGDSIAVGVAIAMPECQSAAQGGISSVTYASVYTKQINADLTVISLGANDKDRGETMLKAMRIVRKRISGKVVWMIPNVRSLVVPITSMANEFGDRVLNITPYSNNDLHPSTNGYKQIVEQIRKM